MNPDRGHPKQREEIKRELSAIVEFETRDPGLKEAFPTVMDVQLSPDARYAKVYVALGVQNANKEAVMAVFRRHRGFFRSELAHRLSLRYTPELHFVLDETVEQSLRLEKLLEEDAREQRP